MSNTTSYRGVEIERVEAGAVPAEPGQRTSDRFVGALDGEGFREDSLQAVEGRIDAAFGRRADDRASTSEPSS